jgi:hypothetical protein
MLPENAAKLAHRDDVTERLRSFMTAHGLTHGDLARLFRIPPETLEDWLTARSAAPPGSLLALMILFAAAPAKKESVSPTAAPSPNFHFGGCPANAEEQEKTLKMVRAI